jgi:glycosyltransferase involved in cell wall biosynthesis
MTAESHPPAPSAAPDAPPVCILLATCNGAAYLRRQVESIRGQSFRHWRLLARDDGSGDATPAILEALAREDPRIHLVEDGLGPSGGAAANFSRLMAAGLATDSDIFFFCDQDDVWRADKLSLQAGRFPAGGREQRPLLVHSDLAVVGEALEPRGFTLVQYMGLDPLPEPPLNYLLTRNFATGCASAANRALLEAAAPVPAEAIMHDWWIALVAALQGDVDYLPEALVNYRQHGANTLGAKGLWHGLNPTRNWVDGWSDGNRELLATFAQARALLALAQTGGGSAADGPDALGRYCGLPAARLPQRLRQAIGLRLRQGNRLLQWIFYLRLALINVTPPLSRERADRR